MPTPDLAERIQVLHADLDQVRRQSRFFGSGATIHRLINHVATAQSTLGLVETRCREATGDDIERLLALAEECLNTARILMAQTSPSAVLRRTASVAVE
jgi:hypothetical protein